MSASRSEPALTSRWKAPFYQSFPSDLLLDYAHNDYAQLLAETGVVGAVLALVSLLFFFRGFQMELRSGLPKQRSWVRIGAFIGCTGLLTHSWVDFNLHIPANAAWFAFLAGLAQTYVMDARATKPGRGAGLAIVERATVRESKRELHTVATRIFKDSNN
jgi:O-antigen ligase